MKGRRKNYCSSAHCPNEAKTKGRCAKHAYKEHKYQHDPIRQKLYQSKEWKAFRLRRLAMNPICEECELADALDVHHIKPLVSGNLELHEVFTIEGTACLCKPCHSRATMQEVHSRSGR